MPQLKSQDNAERLKAIKQYIDLCNEELFYFKHNYLPEEIIDEWIDGMTYYLPHFKDGKNINTNEDYLTEIIEKNLLEDYPRVRKAFTINKSNEIKEDIEREKLVNMVKRNLRNEIKDKLLLSKDNK